MSQIVEPVVPIARVISEDTLTAELADLLLDGVKWEAQIGERVVDATIDLTIEGSSTVTIMVHDPDWTLILSPGLLVSTTVVTVDDLDFALVQVGRTGDVTKLVFADAEIEKLAKFTRPRKAARNKVTRAQFARALCREAGVRFVSPEVAVVQPIASSKDRPTTSSKKASRAPGFAPKAKVKVKKSAATSEQRRNLERILDVAWSRKAPRKVMEAMVAAATQESTLKASATNGQHVGLFQMNAAKGTVAQRRDPEYAAAWFVRTAMAIYKSSPSISVSALCERVEVSGNESAYRQWTSEAKATVTAYLGGTSTTSGGRQKATKKYEFTRGAPGGPKGENSWQALLRLADEVGWRCFVLRGAVHFISEPALFRAKPIATVTPDDPALLAVPDFDFDIGKPVAETTLTINVGAWRALPGQVIMLDDFGPLSGRWLIASVSRSMFSTTATMQLVKPRPKLPEPAADEAESGSTGTGASGAPAPIEKAYEKAKAIDAKKYPYVYGAGHGAKPGPTGGALDCSGAVSMVLEAAGAVSRSHTSVTLKSWGKAGEGKYLTVWTNDEHVWIEFKMPGKGRQHFGTGRWGESFSGAGLKPKMHTKSGFIARHVEGY